MEAPVEVHRLGRRAFLIFLLRSIKWGAIILLASAVAWLYRDLLPEGDVREYGEYGIKILFLLGCAVFLHQLILTYIEYRRHTYSFEEAAFIVTRGSVVRHETVAFVYHQIQNVNIRRDVLDRALGVSQLVIVMVGSNDGFSLNKQFDTTLSALDQEKAKWVQRELLRRARRHIYRHIADRPATSEQ